MDQAKRSQSFPGMTQIGRVFDRISLSYLALKTDPRMRVDFQPQSRLRRLQSETGCLAGRLVERIADGRGVVSHVLRLNFRKHQPGIGRIRNGTVVEAPLVRERPRAVRGHIQRNVRAGLRGLTLRMDGDHWRAQRAEYRQPAACADIDFSVDDDRYGEFLRQAELIARTCIGAEV